VNSFNKLLLVLAAVLAVGVGVAVAAGTNGGSSSDPASTVVDVKGPCDEAEHANDPECTGAQVPEDNQAEDQNDDNGQDVNDPGEAENHNDDNAQGDDDQGEVENNDDDVNDDERVAVVPVVISALRAEIAKNGHGILSSLECTATNPFLILFW